MILVFLGQGSLFFLSLWGRGRMVAQSIAGAPLRQPLFDGLSIIPATTVPSSSHPASFILPACSYRHGTRLVLLDFI